MAGFEARKQELAALNAKIVAGSVDPRDKAAEVAAADKLTYPLAFGMTRADADRIGAWWGAERGIVQPAEFIIGRDGKVISSTYSSGPIGRMEPADAVRMLTRREAQAQKT